MSDIASSLPVRGATGDLLVNLFDYAGNTFNPATKEMQASILAGITGIEASQAAILAGVTGIEGVVALEDTQKDVLAGVTGIEARLPAALGATAMAALKYSAPFNMVMLDVYPP